MCAGGTFVCPQGALGEAHSLLPPWPVPLPSLEMCWGCLCFPRVVSAAWLISPEAASLTTCFNAWQITIPTARLAAAFHGKQNQLSPSFETNKDETNYKILPLCVYCSQCNLAFPAAEHTRDSGQHKPQWLHSWPTLGIKKEFQTEEFPL